MERGYVMESYEVRVMESCEVRVSDVESRGEEGSHCVGLVEVGEEEDEGVVQGNGEGEGLAWLLPSQDEFPIPGSSVSDF